MHATQPTTPASPSNSLSGLDEYRPSETGEELSSRRVRSLYGWWRRFLAAEGRVPARRDFDPTEHPAILPWVYMVKVLPGPAFEFTVNGEEVKRLIGRNTTGERVWRGHPGAFGHELAAYYAAIAQSRRPAGCRGDLGFVGRDFLRFESVDCPLLGPDGEVSHIVGVMDAA